MYTKQDFNKDTVEKRIQKIQNVLASKSAEYSMDGSAFYNFEKAQHLSFDETPEKVAWGFMIKHLQSVKDLVENAEKFPSENMIDEKFGDAINYLILIEGMLRKRLIESTKTKLNHHLIKEIPTNEAAVRKS